MEGEPPCDAHFDEALDAAVVQQKFAELATQTGRSAEALSGGLLLRTKDVTEDVVATTTAAHHGPQDVADIQSGMVALQRAQQLRGAIPMAGIAAQGAHQQRQGRRHGAGGLLGIQAQLLAEL